MSEPLLLLAPGAGARVSSPWLEDYRQRLSTVGRVVPFDYDYMLRGSRRPDPLPQLIERHRQALAMARSEHDGPVFLIGKSMGGRVGCHLALEEDVVQGLICLGYPLRSSGKVPKVRDGVLRALRQPLLLIQGTRDPLCPLELLESLLPELSQAELRLIDGGDHSFKRTKKQQRESGEDQETLNSRVIDWIRQFVHRNAPVR